MKKSLAKISAVLLCLILNIPLPPLARAQMTEKPNANDDNQPKLQCSQSPDAKNEKMTYRLGSGLLPGAFKLYADRKGKGLRRRLAWERF